MVWEIASVPGVREQQTIERQDLVNDKFPNLVSKFLEREKQTNKEKRASRKKSKGKQFYKKIRSSRTLNLTLQ